MNTTGSAALFLRESRDDRKPLTETARNWIWTAAIVVGCVVLFAVIYAIEMRMGRWKDSIRFVLNPMETSMRYLSLSHFFVAGVYMLSSRRMKTPRARIEVAAMLGVGLLLCFGYARLEAASLWIAGLLFFVFFLVHDFRDQIFFYQAHGDAPRERDRKSLSRALFASPFLLLAVLYCIASPAVASGALHVSRVSDSMAALPEGGRWTVALLPAVILGSLFPFLRRKFVASGFGSVAEFISANRPMFVVFGGGLLLWTVGEIATGLPNAIVLLHVVSWYVFTDRMLRRRAPAAPSQDGGFARWRNSIGGFRVLHIGSALALAAVGIVWAYGFSNDARIAPVRILLAPDNFRYWTILHVTISFAGR